jgi:hypothetical protein
LLIIYCYEDGEILLLGIDHFCGDNPFRKLALDHLKVNGTSTIRKKEYNRMVDRECEKGRYKGREQWKEKGRERNIRKQ